MFALFILNVQVVDVDRCCTSPPIHWGDLGVNVALYRSLTVLPPFPFMNSALLKTGKTSLVSLASASHPKVLTEIE